MYKCNNCTQVHVTSHKKSNLNNLNSQKIFNRKRNREKIENQATYFNDNCTDISTRWNENDTLITTHPMINTTSITTNDKSSTEHGNHLCHRIGMNIFCVLCRCYPENLANCHRNDSTVTMITNNLMSPSSSTSMLPSSFLDDDFCLPDAINDENQNDKNDLLLVESENVRNNNNSNVNFKKMNENNNNNNNSGCSLLLLNSSRNSNNIHIGNDNDNKCNFNNINKHNDNLTSENCKNTLNVKSSSIEKPKIQRTLKKSSQPLFKSFFSLLNMCILLNLFVQPMLISAASSTPTQLSGRGEPMNATNSSRVCQSIDIRNHPSQLNKLNGCRVVEGFVQIMLIEKALEKDFENYTFPDLIEITDYLMLFRVNGLKNLSTLFPNLMVIRGNKLFKNYAFVIYEMMDLNEISLTSLTYIGRGAVRIEKNPVLCYVETIDWTKIARHTDNDEINVFEKNKNINECPICPSGKNNELNCTVTSDPKTKLCWNRQHCQRVCNNCGSQACNAAGKCCDDSCIGGCTTTTSLSFPTAAAATTCIVCRYFRIVHPNGTVTCEKKCPPGTYEHMERRCITKDECQSIKSPLEVTHEGLSSYDYPYIPFNGKCVLKCPDGYDVGFEIEPQNKTKKRFCKRCEGKCSITCPGSKIDSIASAQQLRGCNIISGSLEIQIRSQGGANIVKELEQSLSSIIEIQGYLKVVRSFPLLSLNFLKNLEYIRNKDKDHYALTVMDNQNLQDLWDHNITISQGKLFFHFNPKLCFYKIERLKQSDQVFIDEDVARNSNGDKIACNITTLDVNVTMRSAYAVIIKWYPFKIEDTRVLLGYTVYYINAPYKNVTLYDGRDACGGDGWHVDDITETEEKEYTHIITHLEPFTQYAYYVKTYTISTETTGAQSAIQYFTTDPGQPDIVQKLKVNSNSSHEIHLSWEPPKKANGNLTSYVIKVKMQKIHQEILSQRDYCLEPLDPIKEKNPLPDERDKSVEKKMTQQECEKMCSGVLEPISSGKSKIKEQDAETQIEFEDQLHNWVYIKRPTSSNRRKRDTTPINNQTIMFPGTTGYKTDDVFPTDMNTSDGLATVSREDKITKMNGSYYTDVYKTVNASTTSLTISKLKHFTRYSISVRACREGTGDNCSTEVITHVTTLKIENADLITNFHVNDLGNASTGSVRLTWNPPDQPNGVVLAYSIKYSRVDAEHTRVQYKCVQHEEFMNKSKIFELPALETGNYSVQVLATTLAGDAEYTAKKYFYIESPNKNHTVKIVLITLFVVFAVGGCILYYCRRRYMPVNNLKLIASVNPEYMSMQYQPDEWEVPRDDITKLRELGQGSFGMVYEGIMKKNGEDIACAIKTVNENATDRERINFLKEASVMKAFHTYHVVRLFGVVSIGEPTLVIMELMANGDLKGYLRSHRPDTENMKEEDQTMPQPPTLKRILQMAIEIADGMAYLAANKFVHRDLAARNCMVAADMTVKIGDFGMTRDIYETDYYRKGTKGLLPVRWMSPESLKDGVFTSLSDVFSYGVVLWEMATLASQPYQGLSNDQVLRYVIDGGIMERPENCPDILYELMRKCWQHRPALRPSFLDIVRILLDDANPNFNNVAFYYTREGQELVVQMHQAPVLDDAQIPLRHEEAMDDPDAYSYDQNLVDGDGPLPSIRSAAHSPLSGGIRSGMYNDHNYIVSSYQSGKSDGLLTHSLNNGQFKNSLLSNLTLSTTPEQNQRGDDNNGGGGGGDNHLKLQMGYDDDDDDNTDIKNSRPSNDIRLRNRNGGGGGGGVGSGGNLNLLRNLTGFGSSGSGSNLNIGSGGGGGGGGLASSFNKSDYRKLKNNSTENDYLVDQTHIKMTPPPLGNGFVFSKNPLHQQQQQQQQQQQP